MQNVEQIFKSQSTGLIKYRLSNIFQPISVIPKAAVVKKQDATSKSQKLMLELGIIQQSDPGCFYLLPLGMRALDKLIQLVEQEMLSIGAQKVALPALTNARLWKKTGRLDNNAELFRLSDRHDQKYVLSPTHEEAVSNLISSFQQLSYKQFPLKLYQITSKFRDEIKPRFGLMRAREFLMKDLYSFDIDKENALITYETISSAYERIFQKIGVDFVKVLGSSGEMGGSLSHEFHLCGAEIGEDQLIFCHKCQYYGNTELNPDSKEVCPNCGEKSLKIQRGIEVGHTFLLATKYSNPLQANFLNALGKPQPLFMASYGLGLTRILAGALEVLSSDKELRWPSSLAPFNAVIIPPKAGSKEELPTKGLEELLYLKLNDLLPNNVLLDDRTWMTIGRRAMEASRVGYNWIIVIGQRTAESAVLNKNQLLFELIDLASNNSNNNRIYVSLDELISYISKNNTINCKF